MLARVRSTSWLCVYVTLGCLFVNTGSGNQVQLPDEQRLLRKLFKVYTSDVRPVYNSSHNVQVIFNFNLIQIMDMVCTYIYSLCYGQLGMFKRSTH